MIKLGDLLHNSSVVSAIELQHKEQIATITLQGYVALWDISNLVSTGNGSPELHPIKMLKFESNNVVCSTLLLDYDFELYPFIYCQSHNGELEIMHIHSGKSQKLSFSSASADPYIRNQHDQEGMRRVLQSDPQHLVVTSDYGQCLSILSIEFENLKESTDISN